jgi:RNA-directed DNA polymerase
VNGMRVPRKADRCRRCWPICCWTIWTRSWNAGGTASAAAPAPAKAGADDCNIYVRSLVAGERVMASVTSFLENRLRLKVNRQKSAVAPVGERQFLGHRLGRGGTLGIGRKSMARAKDRLREITRRNRGDCSLERMIEQVNSFVTGWVTYYRHAQCKSVLRDLDGWLRRKLRCVKLKRCKHVRTMVRFLIGNGVTRGNALKLASSGKGWWRKTDSQQAKRAMPNAWFDALGLVRLADHHAALDLVGNRRGTRSVRPVV